MAIIKAVNSKASIGKAINYVTKEGKTESKLITGKDCDPYNAIDDMKATKTLWGKTEGREYKHYIQSFSEGENITPEKAHEIANKWAEKEFKGYECLIATHTDKGHIHSHIIVNSVNFETGEKFRQSKEWLKLAKEHSDRLCAEHNLSITQKGKTFEGTEREDMTSYSKDKYNLLEKADQGKAKSYVYDTALAVMDCKEQATGKESFVRLMAEKGYKTEWKDNHKYITFTDQEGNKVRNSNLERTFHISFGKEQLEHEFKQNAQSREAEQGFTDSTELYNTLESIVRNEDRAERARASIDERFRERADTSSNPNFGQSAEERSTNAVRTGASTHKPSEAIRDITETVRRNSVQGRADFRNNLQRLIEKRRELNERCVGAKRKVDEIESRRTEKERRIDELNQRRSEISEEIGRIDKERTRSQSQGMER